jgi:hypothetical protein
MARPAIKELSGLTMRSAVLLGLAMSAALSCRTPTEGTMAHPAARRANRLAKEKSPYLQQHKHNPVDWYPWGDEAFARAKKEDKPIFLSIGYSTCHWCHVMERESFENDEIAAVLNGHFVSIKVDREERPDVDAVYMAAVMAMSGHGGWPLSAFLTPEREPFFAGTYFPPAPFRDLLERVAEMWKGQRQKLTDGAKEVAKAVAGFGRAAGVAGDLDPALFDRAVASYQGQYDDEQGGFGSAPKFPQSVALEFLMRMHRRTGSEAALAMVRRQLDAMMRGGIYDQLGGGFHRYSTDARWLVPHFEKMLYDNALLVRAYLQAWQITREPEYARIVRETCEYVLRDMTSPEGAFYSAEDADSEGFEGTFYLWTPAKLKAVVPGRDGEILCRAFGVVEGGNWVPHEEREPRGNSVVHLAASIGDLSREFKLDAAEVTKVLADGKRKLFEARARRPRPHRDDKILTEWNAMMIGALASAGAALEEPRFVAAAEKAARFVLDHLRRKDGRLLRRHREGESAIPAYLDDYAFLAEALADLYQATFRPGYLDDCLNIAEAMNALFGDPDGGFYFTAKDHETLIVRTQEIQDGAIPSGNAVAAHALFKLAELTSREPLKKAALNTLRRFGSLLKSHAAAVPHLASAADMALSPWREIVIAGDSPEMVREVRRRYLPNTVVVSVPATGPDDALRRLIPMVEGKKAVGGRPAAYVCENYSCKAPVTSAAELARILDAPKSK